MIILNLILFLAFLFLLIKFSSYAIRFSSRIARILHFPEFVVSFFIVALISVLPETTISVIAAINRDPKLGLGTLLGSNVADLTLVFGIVSLISSKGIPIKSKILSNNLFYLVLLVFPLILGYDGELSRIDGTILILLGMIFFMRIYDESNKHRKEFDYAKKGHFIKNLIFLIGSLGVILLSAFLTVKFAVNFAGDIKLPTILIGLTVLALGTCLPELIFSIRAVRKNHDELALGDLLGTVITDATIILGLVALISPFSYNPVRFCVTAGAMFLAGLLTTTFMKTDKKINKIEGVLLILFYFVFVVTEFLVNDMLVIN
ncbi:MAG: sodium:calcium antiporter [Candidatus Omnitrophica bacterium]|nr:sodium:calcium antiporter [Candidatus Omnitrophota bacterium]